MVLGLSEKAGRWQTGKIGMVIKKRNDQTLFKRGHGCRQIAHQIKPVKSLAGIVIAITGNQKFGFNLAKPVTGPPTPKSGEQLEKMPPSAAVASIAITASGIFGI